MVLGNILRGVPVDQNGQWAGSFVGLRNPYALLVGVTGLVLLILHGAAYLALKSEGELHRRVRGWIPRLWIAFVALYVIATVAGFFAARHLFAGVTGHPLFWILTVLLLTAIVYTPLAHQAGKDLRTLLATSVTIICVLGLAALGLFPRLVPSSIDPAHSLTIHNASSTQRTLAAMLVIALVGMPVVLAYTACIYWAFRGKVRLTEESY